MENKTHIVILGLLSEEALTGYDIKKRIDIRFRFFWNESFGQIYPQLKKMEQNGLITASQKQDGGRAAKKYAITALGRTTLQRWLLEPPEKESVRIELLLKLYFADQGNPDILANHIRAFQAAHQQDLMILNLFKQELQSIPDPHHHHENIMSVIEFGIVTNQGYLTWCQDTLKKLETPHDPQ